MAPCRGTLTCKFPHRKRGQEIGPCYKGVLVHDCWASYMGYDQCSHQLCGSHLLRELTFVVEATARLMKSLLREVCHKVNKSASKTLNEADLRAVRKRYRTIRAPGNCPTSRRRRKENVDASPTRTTCTNVS